MDGFVDRLRALRFLRACDPSYRALTFTLVGDTSAFSWTYCSAPFSRACGRQATTVYSGQGADIVMQSTEISLTAQKPRFGKLESYLEVADSARVTAGSETDPPASYAILGFSGEFHKSEKR